jgi:tol-pal system protein YbgF
LRASFASRLGALILAAAALAGPAAAQSVADIKAELTLLDSQVQQLRDELVRSGASGGLPRAPATALTRLDQLQAELRQLTDRVDVLTNDIRRIVDDASNKMGDIEFRVTELEGGDTSFIPTPTPPLGGGLTGPRPRPAAPTASAVTGGGQLAATEQSDFDAAVKAADSGDSATAAQLFTRFLETYPSGPLSTDAQYQLGEARAAQGDWGGAARSFLDAFSGAPQGPLAPQALYKLADALAQRGQVAQACMTLIEVEARYPGSAVSGDVATKRQALSCQ